MIDKNNDSYLDNNIFSEEFQRVSNGKDYISLSDILKMSILDDNGDFKINLCHIPTLFFLDSDKDGLFTLNDFSKLSKISEEKEKEYKRYEFSAQLQAYFTLLMWKNVCSDEGEKKFVEWIKKLIYTQNEKKNNNNQNENTNINNNININSNNNTLNNNNNSNNNLLNNNNSNNNLSNINISNNNNSNNNLLNNNIINNKESSGNKSIQNDSNINNTNIESDEDYNPDPSKYIDRNNLRMLYDVLNVKTTHGIDFQSFFELMKIASDDFVLLSVLDFFCVNFIRGFNKLILDLGFDSFENDFDN